MPPRFVPAYAVQPSLRIIPFPSAQSVDSLSFPRSSALLIIKNQRKRAIAAVTFFRMQQTKAHDISFRLTVGHGKRRETQCSRLPLFFFMFLFYCKLIDRFTITRRAPQRRPSPPLRRERLYPCASGSESLPNECAPACSFSARRAVRAAA